MSPLRLLMLFAIVGALAGFGVLSNDILLNTQSFSVWDTLSDFTQGHACECQEIVNGVPTGEVGSQYCPDTLTQHGQDLCT